LALALAEHNQTQEAEARFRLRFAIHAGEVRNDDHGVAGTAINFAFRLLDAAELKAALSGSSGLLAVIASRWFFEEVIRHDQASVPASYRKVLVAVKETRASAWIRLPGDPSPSPERAVVRPAGVTVPRQLPASVSGFAGREPELKELTEFLDETVGATSTVVISAVSGTAGIGKTALAVQWAHQVAERFPDGQLYVNLRGFDPTGSPMAPGEAIRGFLDAFDLPIERIPVSLDAQAALYRSLLADLRVLIVLDNARDSEQVRPLLPGSPGCAVIVTSRNHLTSLVATEGARPLSVDLFNELESRQLLARRIGARRVDAEPRSVTEIIKSCVGLPLALSIVAARAATHPQFPLMALSHELRDARENLDAFNSGDLTVDVRAVFSWSYRRLSITAARLFRLLGVHPGPDVSTPAAISLAGLPAEDSQRALAELTHSNLLVERVPGRFTFHDLLRTYAVELTQTRDSETVRHAAIHRLLDHYLHSANNADAFLQPRIGVRTVTALGPSVTPEQFTSHRAAVNWFETEHHVLLAALQFAVTAGWDSHAWQLPCVLEEYLDLQGHRNDDIEVHRIAVRAAQRQCDRYGQAHAHCGLGRALHWLGYYEDTLLHLEQARSLFEEIGDRVGQAHVRLDISHIFEHQGNLAEALPHAEKALALAISTDSQQLLARSLQFVSWYHAMQGNPQRALPYGHQALTLDQERSEQRFESYTLITLGYAYHQLGEHQQAIAYYRRSLALRQELGDRYNQVKTLAFLGDTHLAAGDATAARDVWQQAADILDQFVDTYIGHVNPEQVKARLLRLKEPSKDPVPELP
jgi:tetratricopeptide (TPR) repeat protein